MASVSVLTPTYRHAAFIGECIRSVRAQTVDDWEMVVVDDGSDDGTADIAESFADPRIVVLRRPHEGASGLGRAYASALAASSAPIVAILEGDDTWPPDKLEHQLPHFDNPAIVLSYGTAELIDEQGCAYARYRYAPRRHVAANDPVGSILPALARLNFIVAVTVMVRRSALERIGGFVQPLGVPYVDHPTWLRLATAGTFARSPHVLGRWRRHSRQVTTRNWFDTLPERGPYLAAVVEDARGVVAPAALEELARSSRADASRQREEARLAHGRLALVEGRWREAAGVFAHLVRVGEARTRAVAAFGLVCAGSRTDMERLISAMGRHSLPSRRHISAHATDGEPGTLKGRSAR